MVVFWNEISGRQPQLITPENGGDDNTNDPSPPNYTFFDDPDVPFGPGGPPAPHGPPGPPSSLAYLRHLMDLLDRQVRSITCCDRERVGRRKTSRDRLHPRPSQLEFLII